jgi:succinyl-CoA synthetase beta subunit
MQLITHQTGPEGQKVKRLYVEQGIEIARELYLGLVVDRETRKIAVMASTEGGVEIEKVAEETPEKILIEFVDPTVGLSGYQARKLAYGLEVGKGTPDPKATNAEFVKLVSKLAELFEKEDCSLCEVNPLIVTKQGKISDADLAAARSAGLNDAQILEVVATTVLNILTNYLNHVADPAIDFPVVSV